MGSLIPAALSRRTLLRQAGAGIALAGSGLGLASPSRAQSAAAELTPGVPSGVASYATMATLPGKKPLIRLADRGAELRGAARIFPHADHAQRRVLRPLPPLRTFPKWMPRPTRSRSAAKARTGRPKSRSTISRKCRPTRSSRSINARATGAACHSRMSPASNGAMAPWAARAGRARGSRTCSAMVGLKPEAIEIAFNGADGPVVDKTPDFIKSLPVWKAIDESTLIAYEMNGAPLPHFNGFPARLIVPGWTGTYWMKHLISVTALTKPQGGFWMNPAYRIPIGKFPVVARFVSQENATSTPITEMVVNSLITSHRDGAKVKAGKVTVSGLAWDARLWHPRCRGFDRRRQDVVRGEAGSGPRPLRLSAVEFRSQRQARQEHGDGQCDQQYRSNSDRHIDLQSRRLPQQRDAAPHAERELKESRSCARLSLHCWRR